VPAAAAALRWLTAALLPAKRRGRALIAALKWLSCGRSEENGANAGRLHLPVHDDDAAVSDSPGYGGDIADADDLTRIAGIGSKVGQGLNEAGIRTYAKLASRFAQDIMALLPGIGGLPLARVDALSLKRP